MSPKSGRCPNAGTSVPQPVMEQVGLLYGDSISGRPDRVGAHHQRKEIIPGVDVLEASYAIWLGPNSINEALKTE